MAEEQDLAQQALFREVDEELRQENLKKVWDKYGILIIGSMLLIVFIVAGYQGWASYKNKIQTTDSAQYQAAMELIEQGKTKEAAQALTDLSISARTGYRDLARMRSVSLYGMQGEIEVAMNILQGMISDKKTDPVFRQLAAVSLAMFSADFTTSEDYSEAMKTMIRVDSPWHSTAMEIQATILLREGKVSEARKIFKQLTEDSTATAGVRSRAAEMLIVLKNKADKVVKKEVPEKEEKEKTEQKPETKKE